MLGALSAGAGGSLGTLFVKLTADSTQLVRGMEQSRLTIERSAAVILRQVGLMAAGVTAALTGIGAVGVKLASDFESSFAGVRKTVNATEAEFAQLEKAFRKMSREMPTSVNDINAIAEAAGQLGIKTANIEDFTKTIIDLGNATNLVGSEGATALARFANITQMPQDQFDNLGSTIVELGNNLATTEAEIMAMALRIAGAGTQVGLTEDQIVSFAAALSSVGVEAEAGGTAISQMMVKMAKAVSTGSEELVHFAGAAGMSTTEFAEAFRKDATGAILTFMNGLKAVSDSGGDVFTMLEKMGLDGMRVTDVMLRASGSGNLFADALKRGSDAWEENAALTEEARKRYETFESQVKILWNTIKDLLITIGQELIPAVKALMNVFSDATVENENFAAGFDNFAKQSAPVFLKVIGMIGDAIGGWKLIIKAGEAAFATYAAATLEIYVGIAKGIAGIVQSIVNNIIDAANSAIRAVNKVLPEAQELSEIDMSMNLDMTNFDAWVQGFSESAAEARAELVAMANAPKFSEVLQAEYTKLTDAVKKQAADSAKEVKALTQESTTAQLDMMAKVEEAKKAQEKRAVDSARVTQLMEQLKTDTGDMLQFDAKGMAVPEFGLGDMGVGATMQMTQDLELARDSFEQLKALSEEDLALTEQVQQQKLAMMEAYNQKVQALQFAQTRMVLGTSEQMFMDLADIAAAFSGKQSGVYKAMFAISKAFAIADAIVKIQMGIANAMSLPWPANLAAVGSVVAATSSIVSTIQSVKLEFGGARETGGPVTAGKAFLVGEAGPELFKPPGSGNIIPNDQLGGSKDGGNVRVVINNYTDAQPEVSESQDGEERVINVVIKRVKDEIGGEIRDGRGTVTQSMERAFGLRRGTR